MGGFRHSGVTDASGSVSRLINFSGFQPSGLTDGNIVGVGLYVWSGNAFTGSGYWTPLEVGWLK